MAKSKKKKQTARGATGKTKKQVTVAKKSVRAKKKTARQAVAANRKRTSKKKVAVASEPAGPTPRSTETTSTKRSPSLPEEALREPIPEELDTDDDLVEDVTNALTEDETLRDELDEEEALLDEEGSGDYLDKPEDLEEDDE
jgi:hypothetical protein